MKLKFLNRFKIKDVIYLEGMSRAKANDFLAGCANLQNNKYLKLIIERLIQAQGDYLVKKAPLERILPTRGGINSLFLLEEEIAKNALLFKDEHKKQEFFDKYDIV